MCVYSMDASHCSRSRTNLQHTMKTQPSLRIIPFAILASLMSPAFAEAPEVQPAPSAPAGAPRALEVEGAKIDHVRQYLHGFGHSLVFITIPEQKAVVKLHVSNTTRDFSTSGQVILFAPDADADKIAGWINNQHSCGLFPEVAEPVFTDNLPEDGFTLIDSAKVGEATGPTDHAPYHDYKVKIGVKAHAAPGQYSLKAFEIETGVFLKVATQ